MTTNEKAAIVLFGLFGAAAVLLIGVGLGSVMARSPDVPAERGKADGAFFYDLNDDRQRVYWRAFFEGYAEKHNAEKK